MISPKKKKYITVSGFILLFLILSFGVILPLFSSIKKDAQEISLKKGEIISFQNKITNLNKISSDYAVFQSNLEKMQKLFINSKEPLEFISFLEKTSENCSLSMDIVVNNLSEKSKGPALNFQISLSGSFSGFMKFLEKIESADYLVDVNTLNVQKFSDNIVDKQGKKIQRPNYIQANLNINVFSTPN